MRAAVSGLAAKHPSGSERRGIDLFYVIELVNNRETREPISAFN